LWGFEPKNIEEWNRENWTSGCVRTALQCERVNNSSEGGKKRRIFETEDDEHPRLGRWVIFFGRKM